MLTRSKTSAVPSGYLPMLCVVAFLVSGASARADKAVRVFVLAGQSNMEGKASNKLLESQATDARFRRFWADYRSGAAWAERDDVFVTFFDRHGPLTIGYGSKGATGPELGFGRVVGDVLEDPVLLIKTAWGGHSLYKNFRPPSAGLPSEHELQLELKNLQQKTPAATIDQVKAGYGESYRMMLAEIRRVLAKKDELFPVLEGLETRISGVFWFQGFNDQFGDSAPGEYEANMKYFISDVRRDLGVPRLPFVIAGIGTFGADGSLKPKAGTGTEKVLRGQLAMNAVQEFRGTVKAFETAPLYDADAAKIFPMWKENLEEWKKVGSDRPYHYLGSGIWYSRIGMAAGEAMVDLLGN